MTQHRLDIPTLLHQAGLKPDKRLGQNFLTDDDALDSIIAAAQITPTELVLEIGAGLGSLTYRLAGKARQVIAVELDRRLIPILREVLAPFSNIQIMQGDILTIDLTKILPPEGYLVVANIPYYITSAIIRHLIELPVPPNRFVLTIQSEVAERICAEAGDMSLLALSVQIYGQPRLVTRIPASAFYPTPTIDSAVVRVDLFPVPLIDSARIDVFFRLIKAGFSQKRKTLRNALAGGLGYSSTQAELLLKQAGIDPMRRAETLSIPEWEQVVDAYTST